MRTVSKCAIDTRLRLTRAGAVLWNIPAACLPTLPEAIEWNGIRLRRKHEFHLTVLGQASTKRLRRETSDGFERWLREWPAAPATIELLDELWLLHKPAKTKVGKAEDSVAVACLAPAFEEARALLSRLTGVALPEAPAHVTLFIAGRTQGIAVPDFGALEERRIEVGSWAGLRSS